MKILRIARRSSSTIALCVALSPVPAQAHLNSTGMGPVYDGLIHFFTSPEDAIPVLAIALIAGLRGASYGRRALFVLPSAWVLGGFLGLTKSATNGSGVASALWFLLLGGLVAADARLSLSAVTVVVAFLGLHHGFLNGAGMGVSDAATGVVLGLASAVFVLVALAAAFVVRLRAEWARIAVRVVGSWIAASGILMIGWALHSPPLGQLRPAIG
jgi:hydrogenase/urease accessory protein HupE